jgi:creatinine amidohydrolase
MWATQTWPELLRHCRSEPTEVALLPVGATEQHGPHLPTGTDTVVATSLVRLVARRTGALVLPALAYGASYGHGDQLPGTVSLTPEQLAGLVRQVVEWAARSGVCRFLVVNAHMGNRAACEVAIDHLRFERPDLRIGMVEWWSVDPAVAEAAVADGRDIHANRAETSIMLALAPELVRTDLLAEADDPDRTAGLVFRYCAPALSTNGVTGSPSTATAELGRWMLERTVAAISELVVRGRSEEPPLTGHETRIPRLGSTGVRGRDRAHHGAVQ